MRKSIAFVLMALMVFAVVSGCISKKETQTSTIQAEVKKKIAIVYDVGGRGDLSFNDIVYLGVSKAAKDFNLEVKEVQSKTANDYLPNLRSLAKTGNYEVIIGVGFLIADAISQVADEFPNQKFIIVDTVVNKPNVVSVVCKENEGGALAGVLAGLIAASYGKDKVGVVLGMEIPPVIRYEAGYHFGVAWAEDYYAKKFGKNVDLQVLYTYTGTFTDPAKGKQAAQAQLAQGAWVVYQLAGATGLGVFDAVEEFDKSQGKTMGPPFALGADASQEWIKPGFIIASSLKRLDVGVYRAIEMAVKGEFKGGILELGLKEDGVGLSTPEKVKEMLDTLPKDVKAKKLKEIGVSSEEELLKKIEEARRQVPDWIWEAVKEFEEKVKNGEIKVPGPTNREGIEKIRKAKNWKEMEELAG